MGIFSDIADAELGVASPKAKRKGRFTQLADEELGVATVAPEPQEPKYEVPPPPQDLEEVPYEEETAPPPKAVPTPDGGARLITPDRAIGMDSNQLFDAYLGPPPGSELVGEPETIAAPPEAPAKGRFAQLADEELGTTAAPEENLTDEQRAEALGAALEGLGKATPPREGLPQFGAAPEGFKPPLADALARGVGMGVSGVGGTIQTVGAALENAVQDPSKRFDPFAGRMIQPESVGPAGAIKSGGSAVTAAGEKIQEDFPAQTSGFEPANPTWWIERGGELAPQLAAQTATLLATGGMGGFAQLLAWAAPAVVMEGGSAFNQAKALGASDDQAALEGVTVAAGSAFLESIGGSAILGKIPGAGKFFKDRLKNAVLKRGASIVGAAGAEGATEAAQEAWADTVAYYGGSNPKAFEGAKERYLASAAVGSVAGGGMSVAMQKARGENQPAPVADGTPAPAPKPEPKLGFKYQPQGADVAVKSKGRFTRIVDEELGVVQPEGGVPVAKEEKEGEGVLTPEPVITPPVSAAPEVSKKAETESEMMDRVLKEAVDRKIKPADFSSTEEYEAAKATYAEDVKIQIAEVDKRFSKEFGPIIRPSEIVSEKPAKVRLSKSASRRGAVSVGRPDLANPGVTEDARSLVHQVDIARNKMGKPERRSDEELSLKVNERLTQPGAVDEEKSRLLEAARTGATFGDRDTLIAKKIVAQQADQAIKSGNREAMLDAARLITAWRDVGAEQARAFRQRIDPLLTPQERMKEAFSTSLLTPNQQDLERMEMFKKKGEHQQADMVLRRHVERMEEVKKRLKAVGVDIDAMMDSAAGELDSVLDSFERQAKGLKSKLQEVGDLKIKNMISRHQAKIRELHDQLAANAGNATKIEKLIEDHNREVAGLVQSIGATNISQIEAITKNHERRKNELMERLAEQAPNKSLIDAYRGQLDDEFYKMKTQYAQIMRETDPGNIERIMEEHRKRVQKLNEKFAEKMFLHREFMDEVNAAKAAMDKQIEQMKGRLKDINKQKADAKKLMESTRDKILSMQEKISKGAQLAVDRNKMAQALREIAAAKSDNWDAAYEYWISAILSGPTTHAANIIGNASNIAWDQTIQRLAEATLNLVVQDPSSAQFGELKAMVKAILPSLHLAARNSVLGWRFERPILEDEIGAMGGHSKLEAASRAAITGKKGRFIRAPLRSLTAADEFFSSFAARMEVAARAYRLGRAADLDGEALTDFIESETLDLESDSWLDSVNHAQEMTFRADPGSVGTAIKFVRSNIPGTRYVVPFVNTPVNIFKTAIRKSPLGSAALAYRSARQGLVKIGADKSGWTYSAKDFNRHAAEQVIGLSVLAALFPYVFGDDEDDLPRITGTTPYGTSTTGERQLAQRAAPDTSIRIGEKWYSYARIEPFATALSMMVDGINGMKQAKNGKEMSAAFGELFNHAVAQAKDKTFLSGIGDILDAMEDGGRALDYAKNFTTSWVPNILKQVARSTDDEFHDSKSQSLAYKAFPVSPLAPPAKVDLWGREAKKAGVTGHPASDFLYRLTVPVAVQNAKEDFSTDLDRMILNWNNQNPNEVFAPTLPRPDYTVDGEQKKMNPNQYNRFLRESGQLAVEILKARLEEADFSKPTPQDISIMDKAISDARRRVKDSITRN